MNEQHVTDRDLRAAFVARAAGAPSPDLAARISAEAAGTRQSRPLLSLPAFLSPGLSPAASRPRPCSPSGTAATPTRS